MTERFEYAEPITVESTEDCDFYHSMHVPGIGEVSGDWDLRAVVDDYLGGVDFSGKRVLDVGTASGFLSFEMEKRGAEVVSFDLDDAARFEFVPHFKQQHDLDKIVNSRRRTLQRRKNSYWLAHRALQSSARVYYGNIYDLPDGLGRFDIVVLGMVLSHLRDPFQALYSGSRLSTTLLIVTNQTMKMEEPFACFMPDPDDKSLITAWWGFSDGCMTRMLGVLGFRVTHTVMSRPECLVPGREGHELCTAFVGERMSTGLIDALTSGLGRKGVS